MVANPNLPRGIGVKVAAANAGEYVIVRNLTKGGQLTQPLKGTDKGTVFNPAPELEWEDGDVIQAEIRGRIAGAQQKTIQKGTVIFTINPVTDTTTPGVNL